MYPIEQPRPILKRSSNTLPPQRSSRRPMYSPHVPPSPPAVHFPPSPTLTRTFSAHSSTAYDRTPIVVAPNTCALPERGGRTYDIADRGLAGKPRSSTPSRAHNGHHMHPRALERCRPLPIEDTSLTPAPSIHHTYHTAIYPPLVLPPLIPDISSSEESEESDGIHSPPSEPQYPSYVSSSDPQRSHVLGLSIPFSKQQPSSYDAYHHDGASPSTPTPLSFLPHPPSPPENGRRSSRHRKRSPTTRYYSDEGVAPMEASPPQQHSYERERRSHRHHRASSPLPGLCKSMSNFGLQDQDNGCLGGF